MTVAPLKLPFAFWTRLLAWIAVAGLIATAVSLPFASLGSSGAYCVDVRMTSDHATRAQLYFDLGRGFNENDSVSNRHPGDGRPHRMRYLIPGGTLQRLRFDPSDAPGSFVVESVRIGSPSGRTIWRATAKDIRGLNDIQAVSPEKNGATRITTVENTNDPQIEFQLPYTLKLEETLKDRVFSILPLWAAVAVAVILLALLLDRARKHLSSLAFWAARYPVRTLAGIAAAAVALQCHPVLFFGKSFVSPDNAVFLLYDHFPTLPGYESTGTEDGKGSDVAALLHENIHYPGLQRDALLKDHELPLWDRYVVCGQPLLGQGQSMFGGLLNIIPMLGRSSSLSWDIRFLVTRWLYAFGLGVAVWLLTRHWAAASITAFSGIYIGFYAYRLNHMAQFSLAVAPWVLVAWLLIRDARRSPQAAWAYALLVLSGWELIHSGTVKEAYMLLVFCNLAGACLVAAAQIAPKDRILRILGAAIAGVILVLLSAPTWLVFLDTLRQSETHYDHAVIRQAAPWQLVGFFEDLFVRQLSPDEHHRFPSTNIIVLLGVSWALISSFHGTHRRACLVLSLSAVAAASLSFGGVPASVLSLIPGASTIQHFDNTFGCVLAPISTILAGLGIHAYLTKARVYTPLRSTLVCLVPGLFLIPLFLAGTHRWLGTPFFNLYAASLGVGVVLIGVAPALSRRLQHFGLVAVVVGSAVFVLLWRHSQYLRTPFDAYVFNPRVRVDWNVRSPAIEHIRGVQTEPTRVVGLSYNLFTSYATTLRLETIYGVGPLRNPYYDELTFKGGILKMNWGDPANWHEDHIRYLLPLQNMLNVKYYVAGRDQSASSLEGLEPRGNYDLAVYESPGAWPRAFFTTEHFTYDSVEELLRETRRNFPRKPFAAIPGEETAKLDSSVSTAGPAVVTAARDYVLTTNSTSFVVDAPSPGMVVLNEAYNPDATVTIDGVPAPLLRVNHAFRGIQLAHAGTFHIRFAYWPRRLTFALCLSALGALLASTGFALVHRGLIRIVPQAAPVGQG